MDGLLIYNNEMLLLNMTLHIVHILFFFILESRERDCYSLLFFFFFFFFLSLHTFTLHQSNPDLSLSR
jgi:hypothetical protein